jgi:lipopolysaccharide/colanic/teichoic acid biosynthesis glycosyltransferase
MRGQTLQRCLKRALDIGVAAIGLCVFSPLLLLTAVAVWVKMGRPILFRQQRPGRNGRPFVMLKFRTMAVPRTQVDLHKTDTERLTPLGGILRRTSLDELPQLWNVLRGDMSLVGPRPLLMSYLPYYTKREHLRHAVRPGITGWAQVHGRNLASWDERLADDVSYVETWSLLLDLRIFALTITQVLRRKNVVADPRSVMPDLDEERATRVRIPA